MLKYILTLITAPDFESFWKSLLAFICKYSVNFGLSFCRRYFVLSIAPASNKVKACEPEFFSSVARAGRRFLQNKTMDYLAGSEIIFVLRIFLKIPSPFLNKPPFLLFRLRPILIELDFSVGGK